MSVTVVVPFSSDDPHRVAAKQWVYKWWISNFPEWHVLQTASFPFNKAKAVNLGVQSTSADTLVIADADCFVHDIDGLKEIVAFVDTGKKQWAVPHKHVYRLEEKHTESVYAGEPINLRVGRLQRSVGCIGGGLVVVSRFAWDTVGGFDTRYEGWGGEDVSFGLALQCLVGPETRGALDLIHLWHPPHSDNYKVSELSARLIQDYRSASRSPDRMRSLVQEKK